MMNFNRDETFPIDFLRTSALQSSGYGNPRLPLVLDKQLTLSSQQHFMLTTIVVWNCIGISQQNK